MTRTRQRANGDGDVFAKNKAGKTIGYRGAYYGLDGKRRYVSGKTKSEAREALKKAKADRDGGVVFDTGGLSIGQFLERWLEDSVRARVAHRTYHNYRAATRNHLAPSLGRVKLKTLSPAQVQGMYRQKLDEGLASASVRQLHDVLSGALEQATRWGLVPRNVCSVVDPPRVVNEEFVPLDPSQSARFLEAARGDRYEALYALALLRGLRQGELFGLMRRDLDLEARTLRVERQLQRMRDGSGLQFSEPKHGSKREMKLPSRVVDALGEHLERQAHEARIVGVRYEDRGLVFASQTGSPLDASNVVGRSFKPLLRSAGLPDIRFHDLRHTCATLLFLDGAHPKRVQQLLGHKSIAVTLDRYSHWIPDLEDTTVDVMDRLF